MHTHEHSLPPHIYNPAFQCLSENVGELAKTGPRSCFAVGTLLGSLQPPPLPTNAPEAVPAASPYSPLSWRLWAWSRAKGSIMQATDARQLM